MHLLSNSLNWLSNPFHFNFSIFTRPQPSLTGSPSQSATSYTPPTPVIAYKQKSLGHQSQQLSENVYRIVPTLIPTDYPSFFNLDGEKKLPLPAAGKVIPIFTWDGDSFKVEVELPEGTSCYGTGECVGGLLRNGKTVSLWNTDAPYNQTADRLYQSHPFVLAVRADGSCFGIIFDSTFRLTVSLNDQKITVLGENPFPVIVIEDQTPQKVMVKLSELVGRITLPPKWSLGYHQCRYSYHPDTKAKEIADEFRARNIPCDTIWLDIHYMHGYRIFTFDPAQFPDPKDLNDHFHSKGFHSVWMIDPGVKQEEGYKVYDEGTKGDHWVRDEQGKPYVGQVWPGNCVFPDFTVASTREWWGGLYKDFMAQGVDGVWNDMNEPAVFNCPTKTMPPTNVHRGEGGGTHDRFHNVYGMMMSRATRDGVMKVQPNIRPFILTRSTFLGGHKYAATWTGDNASDWGHLHSSIPMVLNLGLSGQPYSGPDIGGFGGNADPCLFARWMGFGALLPFARGHSDVDSVAHEPWSFGDDATRTCRVALQRRYRLLDYYYSLFHESSLNGMPVLRPLFFADPSDPRLRNEDRAFTIGDNLLVVVDILPPSPSHPSSSSALPPCNIPKNCDWVRVFVCGDEERGTNNLAPILVRPGSITPLSPPRQYVEEKIERDIMTLLICLSTTSSQPIASGSLYQDSGNGWEYKEGQFLFSKFTAQLQHVHDGDGDEKNRLKKKVVIQVEEEGDLKLPQDRQLDLWVIVDGIHFPVQTTNYSRYMVVELQ